MTTPIFILLVMLSCFVLSVLAFIHIIRTFKKEDKSIYKKINEIITGILLVALGCYYPLFIMKFGGNSAGIVYPTLTLELAILGFIGIDGVMLGIGLWAISQKIQTIRHPELLEEVNNYDVFSKNFLRDYEVALKRKITHILPFGVVGGLILIFAILQFIPIFSNVWRNYALFFIVILGMDFALIFLVGDLIRLLDYSYMPKVVGEMFATGLTPNELDTFASTSIMVFGFAPFLLLDFPVFLIIMLITSVADGMASIFGIIAYNRNKIHIFPKGSRKSIEGYIGGFIFTFLCVLFGGFLSNIFGYSDPSVWSLDILLTLGIILSIVTLLIDIITSKNINLLDNYINPFICGLVIMVFLVIMGIPF